MSRKPKTLTEWLGRPMDDTARLQQLSTALSEHAFNVRVADKTWNVFRFALLGGIGTMASSKLEPSGNGMLTATYYAWDGALDRRQVREMLENAVGERGKEHDA
jgi:hypothetical protein